jgi:hypothetical protein
MHQEMRFSPQNRLELLVGYKNAMKKRFNWGKIDPDIIANEVQKMIAEEKAKNNGKN